MANPIYYTNFPPQQHYYHQPALPVLKILEQPTVNFRYRYKSEDGTHGSIQGENSSKTNKTYPEVQLDQYAGPTVTIKASLYLDGNEQPHVHELTGDREVVAGPETRFIAKFQNLRINQTQKREVREKLMQYMRSNPNYLHIQDEDRIGKAVDEQLKKINLNVAVLKFEAFDIDGQPMCDPIFSHKIHNGKSAQFTRLQICRMDKVEGSCVGGDEVFLLCEKVQKGNINIKFTETINGKEVWSAYGKFNDCDIHHQYAIVFKTPKYKDDITHDVKVSVKLERPKDKSCSDEFTFTYTPVDDGGMGKKRRKTLYSDNKDWNNQNNQNSMGSYPGQYNFHDPTGPATGYSFNYPEGFGSRNSLGDSSHGSQSSRDSMVSSPPSSMPLASSSEPQSTEVTSEDSSASISAIAPDLITDSNTNQSGEIDFQDLLEKYGYDNDSAICSDGTKPSQSERKKAASDGGSTDSEGTTKSSVKAQSQSSTVKVTAKEPLARTASLPSLPSGAEAAYRLTVRSARTLHDFAQTGDVRILLMGMRHLIAVQDENGDNVVHASIIHAQIETLTHLVEVARTIPDYDILNMWNALHQTPLHLAVHTERPEVVRLLLSHGANPNIQDRKGNTPIHLAAGLKTPSCLLALLDAKSYNVKKYNKNKPKLDCPNYSGRTPLHLAAICNSTENVTALYNSGANVNHADGTSGRTPLHIAVENRCVPIIRLLLEVAKADVDAKMFNGNTALHLASSIGNTDCVQLLMEHNADPMAENLEAVRVTATSGDDLEEDEEEGQSPDSSWERIGQTPVDLASSVEIRSILKGETTLRSSGSCDVKPTTELKAPVRKAPDRDSGMSISSRSSSSLREPDAKVKTQAVKTQAVKTQAVKTQAVTTAAGDSGLGISSKSELDMLDLKTKTRLAKLLDPPSKNWMKVADRLHLTSFMHILEEETSPTFAMFEYIDTLKELRTALEELDYSEALDIIESSCPSEEEWSQKSSVSKTEEKFVEESLSKLHL